jgi:hypothetical protein
MTRYHTTADIDGKATTVNTMGLATANGFSVRKKVQSSSDIKAG